MPCMTPLLYPRTMMAWLMMQDADKTGYLGYYKQLLDSQLITAGGFIVVDNALMKVGTCFPLAGKFQATADTLT